MINQKPKELTSISVISSAVCNLSCSFCFLHKNQSYKEYDKIVHAAWEDGSYIDNVFKTVKNFPSDPKKIKTLQLWGGETLLNINDITKNLEKIYEYFPGITEWEVSTNWIINIDNFFNFLCKIDEVAKENTDFILQTSIDGPEGIYTEMGHNGKWELYNKNFEKFFNLVNNTFFKKLHITIIVNATVAEDIFYEKFVNYDDIKNYMSYMYNFGEWLKKNCISKFLEFGSYVIFPGMTLPYYDSVEDGQKLANIYALWDRVRHENFNDIDPFFSFYRGSNGFVWNDKLNSPNSECSELVSGITIEPDGSICECSGSYIDHLDSYKKELEEEGLEKHLNAAKLREAIHYNPGKMTEEEVKKHDWYIKNGYKNNTSTYMMAMFAVCRELLASGQISKKYINDDLLLRHLRLLCSLVACTRENIRETSVPYLIMTSCFRRYLNGAMDYIYEDKMAEMYLKKKRKYSDKIEKLIYD